MAVAELQRNVSQGMVRSPVAPVPPAMPPVPVAAVVTAPTEPVLEAAPVGVQAVNPAQPSAFTYLSDFAFWEGCGIDTAFMPAEPLVSAAPAEPRKPCLPLNPFWHSFAFANGTSSRSRLPPPIQPVVETPAASASVEVEAPEPVAVVQVETPAPQPVVTASEIAPEVAGESTEDEVMLTVAEAEEHVVEEVAAPEPIIEKPAPVKAAPSIALYQPQPSPRGSAGYSWQL